MKENKPYLYTKEGILNYFREFIFIYVWAVPVFMMMGYIEPYALYNTFPKISGFCMFVTVIGIVVTMYVNNKFMTKVEFQHLLVTTNIYKYTRNPLYIGQSMYVFGFATVFLHWSGVIAYIALLLANHITILSEEKKMEKQHGNRYLEYKKTVPRYLFWI